MKNTNNYLLALILFFVGFYSIYTRTYYSAVGWFLLGISIISGIYLSKIGAEKKYFYLVMILPIASLICFVYDFFY